MPCPARYCLLLFASFCLLSTGCQAVFVPNGLPEEYRADIPGLEGMWTAANEDGAKSFAEVERVAAGSYTTTYDVEGGQNTVKANTYIIDDQAFATVEWNSTNLDFDSASSAHPVLVKIDFNDGRLSAETLAPKFLRDNPNVLPHYRLGKPSGDSGDSRDYVTTATPEQLANFLSLIEGNPDAWSPQGTFIKQPDSGVGQPWFAWLWSLFFFGWVALSVGAKVIGWLSNETDRQENQANTVHQNGALRRTWVNDIIQLLIWTARSPRADQALTSRERSLIKNIAISEAKRPDAPGDAVPLSSSEIDRLVSGYERDSPGISDRMKLLAEPKNAALRTRIVKRVWQIIVHDGPASDEEVGLAMSVAAEFKMPEEEFLSISKRYHRPQRSDNEELDKARTLLGVSASATAEDVRRAYKRKAREYHPDAHSGVSENLKRLAAEHFKKICDAQELLLAVLDGSRLVAKGTDGRLVPADDLPKKVQCFSCAAIRPGTSRAEAASARCPRCFTLLSHEPDFAAELNRGAASSNPVSC